MKFKLSTEIMEIIKKHIAQEKASSRKTLPKIAAEMDIKSSTLRAIYYDVTTSITLDNFIKLVNYFDIMGEIINDTSTKTDTQSTGME